MFWGSIEGERNVSETEGPHCKMKGGASSPSAAVCLLQKLGGQDLIDYHTHAGQVCSYGKTH